MLTGAADILLGAPQQNMRVQILGQPVFVFAGFVNKFASNVVIKKEIADRLGIDESSPVMDKARALEGLRMGTTGPGGGPDQLLRYFLGRAGFDPDTDAQLVRVQGGSAMIAAMQQDQIDGFCLSSPTSRSGSPVTRTLPICSTWPTTRRQSCKTSCTSRLPQKKKRHRKSLTRSLRIVVAAPWR